MEEIPNDITAEDTAWPDRKDGDGAEAADAKDADVADVADAAGETANAAKDAVSDGRKGSTGPSVNRT